MGSKRQHMTVPFLQFEKRKKHPWRIGTFTFKLWKWCQIAQNIFGYYFPQMFLKNTKFNFTFVLRELELKEAMYRVCSLQSAGSKLWSVVSRWQEFLFAVDVWKSACVCNFYYKTFTALWLYWQQFYGYD